MFYKMLGFFTGLMLVPALCLFAEEVKWPVPPSGFDAKNNSIAHGKLEASVSFPTRNKGTRKVTMYTPPGYSTSQKYPVLYLHHGIGGNEYAWVSQNGHAEGNADNIMDFLYSKNSAKPMIVAMPNGNVNGDFNAHEDVLINDLIPWVEKTYSAATDADSRAIAGLSMGGGQTLNFGYKNPKVFTWIGAFSPAPNTTSAGTTIRDPATVRANMHLNFLAAGTAESGYLNTARTYHNFLQQNNFSPLYLQVEQGLNHERTNWNRQLYNFASRIFQGITDIKQVEPSQILTAGDKKTLLIRNGLTLTPSAINVIRTGNGLIKPQIYSLDGRLITPLRQEKAISQTIGRTK